MRLMKVGWGVGGVYYHEDQTLEICHSSPFTAVSQALPQKVPVLFIDYIICTLSLSYHLSTI